MNKPYHYFRIFLLVIIGGLTAVFLQPPQSTYAALGWVGNMFPVGNADDTLIEGNNLTVYVQVYKGGVTEAGGQGADISCTLTWGSVASFGDGWTNITNVPMTYNTDIGNNDEYMATISPPAGTYEFTAVCTDLSDNADMGQGAGNGRLTVNELSINDTRAIWLTQQTIAWNGSPANSYKLLYDPDGSIDIIAAGIAPYTNATTAGYLDLTANGTINGAVFPKNPNTDTLIQLDLPGSVTATMAKDLLKGELVIAAYNNGAVVEVTRIQIQSVLDDLYATNAAIETLGVSYSGGAPTIQLWAPTAKSVTLRRYADAATTTYSTETLNLDAASGVWSVTGDASWDKEFYLFDVEVYVPATDIVEHNLVTDPYAVSLSMNSTRSQFVDLTDTNDSSITPTNWTTFSKPALAAPEDIAVYEVHVRDFSRDDLTVDIANRGTFNAFTETTSDGMSHVLALKDAGLTHIHLMPVFDIASVNEDANTRTEPNPSGGRDAETQQAEVGLHRADDSFNWGYDPFHYGVPEGSYSTNPDGVTRIKEFRQMVQTLNENDLRVVMDVVYNHTAAVGQENKSVLDKVVPGYYYRYTLDGSLETSSCCADTASEYIMMEKLMVDTMVRWAEDYKVDGFRFDLMNLHTVANAVDAKTAVQAIDPDIYVYGEGWDFGSAAGKGLDYAKQTSMRGTGIGTFNDRLRDAVHGGYNTDSTQIRHQGFINGLSYDWNGYSYSNRYQSDLHSEMDRLRLALAGSVNDYTDDPQETVNYVSKHDNETLFDQNVFKLPLATSMDDRVRVQNMGLSVSGLAQGIPFFHMASDIMRSKSLDRNSYDSGDWFNRVDWTYNDNNFGNGAPPAWDNGSRWSIMKPLLANTSLDPAQADIKANAAHLREILRIRNSSPLFRLQDAASINARTTFFNSDNSLDGLIAMGLSDSVGTDLDTNYEYIVVFFNANKISQDVTINGTNGFTLHPLQADGIDEDLVVKTAVFNDATDTFTIPARTTAVFVSNQSFIPLSPTTIDWVGLMHPRGEQSSDFEEGNAASDLQIFVQVYASGITGNSGSHTGLNCFLHWGAYDGSAWTDLPMIRNTTPSAAVDANNDEYMVTFTQGDLNTLSPGNYGFIPYCQKPGETKYWKQDSTDINGDANNNDRGDGIISIIPAGDPRPIPAGDVFVHLFEWPWTAIEKECTFLAEKGYDAIQVSPPMEHLLPDAGNQYAWWVRYQPVNYNLGQSRSGTLLEFQSMVTTCNNLGVDVYVDAVINHMTGIDPDTATATGSNGSTFQHYDYPIYDPSDFHFCGTNSGAGDSSEHNITSYSNRTEVQTCELLNLADLNTGETAVQTKIRDYLQSLINMGVAGFRLDGSKHMAAQDISDILDGLTGSPYVFQEVIDLENPNEPIKEYEYLTNGDVTEFGFSQAMANKFNGADGSISDLSNLPDYDGMMADRFAVTFTDNHDNQRGHGPGGAHIVDHMDGSVYNLANVFMLAYPYGYPKVMSSYHWNPSGDPDGNAGPPSSIVGSGVSAGSGAVTLNPYSVAQIAGDVPQYCDDYHWVCEHRRGAIANMVTFRSVTAGEAVTNWSSISSDQIAFGRNDKGFVAINNANNPLTSHTFQTNMTAGSYCDVVHGDRTVDGTACTGPIIVVDGSGQIVNQTVAAMDAFAIHTESRLGAPMVTAFPLAPAVAFNDSTTISSTVQTHDGRFVSGVMVNFALIGGTGSLSAGSATTDAQGVATVAYTAPAGFTVAKVEASITAVDTNTYTDSAFVYVGASTTAQTNAVANSNPFTLGDLVTYGVQVEKYGTGSPIVGVARLDGDVCAGSPGNGKGAVGPFVDVLLENTTNVTGLEIVVAYTETDDAVNHELYWCDENGNWTDISESITPNTGDRTLTFTITGATTPNLSQLEGTPFVVGGSSGDPLAVTLTDVQVNKGMGKTAVFLVVLILISLSFPLLLLASLKKRGL